MSDMKPSPGKVINSGGLKAKGHQAPAGGGGYKPIGKADMKGAQRGQPTDGLKGALSELKRSC